MGSTVRISGISVPVTPHYFPSYLETRVHCKRPLFPPVSAALTSGSAESNVSSSNGVFPAVKDERETASSFWKGFSNPDATEEKGDRGFRDGKLDPLWDDGYGDETVKEYFDYAGDLIRPDGGPTRWFTPLSCGPHLKDSPVLLYLPGIDGLGLGLILHHKALGKVFDVWCMHIPVQDQTPFQDLVKWVEETVKAEHSLSPNKPIYLVGDSIGGCLALTVAARNPHIDLVLILANPATSFGTSQLQPLSHWFNTLPDELHTAVPYLLSFVIGDPVKMAAVDIDKLLPPMQFLEQLGGNLNGLLQRLSRLADIIPKETLLWKLKLLRNGAAYANSRLHSVKAEVLVLASGKDNIFPSRDEAQRLKSTLQNCKVRYFKDHGHSLLLEDGIHLLMIIRGTGKYRRRSKNYDCVMDFVPPSASEFEQEQNRLIRKVVGPVILSTLQGGKIVRGLKGVPNEGPVLYVGYHMLMGIELVPLVEQFLMEKKILVRGLAQPAVFSDLLEGQDQDFSFFDVMRLYGAVAVTPSNFFKLMKAKSHVLLYPGGAREALHSKGEEYKLFWPDEPEFVRMAARFGATIVPFGSVGEDDVAEIVVDHDEQLEIPFWGDSLTSRSEKFEPFNVRAGKTGEVAKQLRFVPLIRPKIPGRFYYLFGEPITTKGQEEVLKDRQKASELYMHIKSQVEAKIAYLLKKREQDPYRGFVERTVHRAFHSPMDRVPTFEPE